MDTFEVRRTLVPRGDEPGADVVVAVFIDGVDLRELVVATQEAELTARFRSEDFLRGSYETLDDWLDPQNQIAFLAIEDVAPPSRHWLGAPEPSLTERGRAAVLTCTCGCYGCGGAAALVAFEDETVTWSEFRHAELRHGDSDRTVSV